MASRYLAILRFVISDVRGASLIEMALIFPPLALLLLGSVDLASGFAKRMALEQAAAQTIQQAIVQGPQASNYDYLIQSASTTSGQPVSNISLDKWLECDGTRQTSFEGDCSGQQVVARRVAIAIAYQYLPPFDYSAVPGLSSVPGLTPVKLMGSARVRVQ
ncbi:TadE/TadG family type IV pilus assembly protein [Sphingomonas oligophenolica]|uniref:TadE-like domain-containing protein n=1 Tax=Sphingomonas oligophenolica TaxID=301154 RepID=A0A502CJT7_9SPHN|nr:TadE/TadG family type IV pilus assembly protein [Sphingomonas oligophenolica]TPG13188.1 hypothetical protein EAH84_07250 [Sphingomonas oligophenolica]